ncbi:MAG: ABC transporter permease, partial [Deltaproteobacteria bacterium]
GDVVVLTVPSGSSGGQTMAPRRLAVRVAGSFRSGMYDFDARLVYLRLDTAQQLLGLGDTVSGLELRLEAPQKVEKLALEVYRAVGRYPYTTRGWKEMNAPLFTALRLQKVVMFLVLCCIVVVASFNIASTLFMAVVERARDIAVLKSMGARDPHIMKIFMLQGLWVGLCGTLLGTALGLAVALALGQIDLSIAADVYMVESLRVRIAPLEVAMVVGAALVIAHLATLYPALRAAQQHPAEVMRDA